MSVNPKYSKHQLCHYTFSYSEADAYFNFFMTVVLGTSQQPSAQPWRFRLGLAALPSQGMWVEAREQGNYLLTFQVRHTAQGKTEGCAFI